MKRNRDMSFTLLGRFEEKMALLDCEQCIRKLLIMKSSRSDGECVTSVVLDRCTSDIIADFDRLRQESKEHWKRAKEKGRRRLVRFFIFVA